MFMLGISALDRLYSWTTSCVFLHFCLPGALLEDASPYGFDSRAGGGTTLDLLPHVLKEEVEALTVLGKWK